MAIEPTILFVAALLAGFVDSIVGGGGLILTPALLTIYPNHNLSSLFGTGKAISLWGTLFAANKYLRYYKQLPLRYLFAFCLVSGIAGMSGAFVLHYWSSTTYIWKILPIVFLVLWIYTLFNPNFGIEHAELKPSTSTPYFFIYVAIIGLSIGFYDGLIGPGTGSFFIFALIRWCRLKFLEASALAKWLNFSSNLGALVVFIWQQPLFWEIIPLMIVANLLGSYIGSTISIKQGSKFIRQVYLVIVLLLIVKITYQQWMT